MGIHTSDLKRMLDDAWDVAPAGDDTLRDTLRGQERAAGLLVSGGSLASVSQNSVSHSYSYGGGSLTAVDIARGWRELIDLFDVVSGSQTGDDAIYAEMKRRLVPAREFTKDFSGSCVAI